MPVVPTTETPGTFQIGDLVTSVTIKVENRVQDTTRVIEWIQDALIEIAGDADYRDEFVELEVFGSPVNLTGNPSPIQEYPETMFLPAGNVNQATLDVMIWQDFPTNTVRKRLEWTSFQDTDRFQVNFPSLPNKAYRFGGNIGFYPVPDQNYQVQSRALIYHPITWTSVALTPILLPQDWIEIIKLSAAEKGFLELEEFDKASAIHNLLHGDPKYPGNVGMLNGRKKKRMKEMWRTEAPLRPTVRSYSYARRGR